MSDTEAVPLEGWDADYCPNCGEETASSRTFEDLLLNRYRTVFHCGACAFHGEVIRHE